MRAKIAQPTAKTLVTQLELVGLRGKFVSLMTDTWRVKRCIIIIIDKLYKIQMYVKEGYNLGQTELHLTEKCGN